MVRGETGKWKKYLKRAEELRQQKPKPFPDEKVSLLLSGGDADIPEEKRVVRVFTSSTFTDTEIERNNLMVDAYPYMRNLCSILGLEFQVVDMRWGVRDERGDDHGTSDLCMSEVHNCLNLSLSCSFITILGNKYGYRPFPAFIAQEEFVKLQACITDNADLELVQKWYRLDTNNIPPKYVLQPIQTFLRDYRTNKTQKDEWWSIFGKIQSILRTAACKCLDAHGAEKYVQSVTEEEIKNGIIHNPNRADTSFFFDREYTNLTDTSTDAYRFIDMNGTKQDIEAADLLQKLKTEIHAKLPPKNCFKWVVDWPNRPTEVPDPKLTAFVDVFCKKLTKLTLRRYDEAHLDYTPVIREVLHHRSIIKTKRASYVVRDDLKKQLNIYLQGSSSSQPFVVHGQGGSGKTSFMANSAADIKAQFPNAVVVARFLGTSLDSSNARSLLYSLTCQITKIYGKDESTVPMDYTALANFECMDFASEERPLFVFLDSLDQMALDGKRLDLEWIPSQLPPNVRMVISTLPDVGGILANLQARLEVSQFMHVPTLDPKDSSKIMENLLKESSRTLMPEQMAKVLLHVAECPLPLYIRLMADICAKLPSYTPIEELPKTINGLIEVIVNSVERNHGKIMVSHALSYITSGRNGLTMNEVEDVLACDDEVINDLYQWWTPPQRRVPPLLWVRISSDLSKYLINRGSDGYTVYAWYHRIWREAIREKYLAKKKDFKHKINCALADYFGGKWKTGKPITDKQGITAGKAIDRLVDPQNIYLGDNIPNVRKLSELPYHQIHCKDRSAEIESISLGHFPFIGAKVKAGKLFELLEDYFLEHRTHKPEDENKKLQEYLTFIKNGTHVLAKDPHALLQLGLNFPDNSAIYSEAESAIESQPNQFFVKWMNKSQNPDPCIITIEVGTHVDRMVVSRDRTKVACVGCDLQVWDLQTGAVVLKNALQDGFRKVIFSHDGTGLYFFRDKKIHILDLATGTPTMVGDGNFPPAKVLSWSISPSGQQLAVSLVEHSDSVDGEAQFTNHVYSFENKKSILCPRNDRATYVEFITESIVLLGFDGLTSTDSIGIWNVESGSFKEFTVKMVERFYNWAVCERYVAIIQTNQLSMWDLSNETNIWSIHDEEYNFGPGLFSKDMKTFLVCDGATLKATPVTEKGVHFITRVESMPYATELGWAHDRLLIFNVSSSSNIKVWDIDCKPFLRMGHIDGTEKNTFPLSDSPLCVVPTGEHGFEIKRLSTMTTEYTHKDGNFLCFSPDGTKICFSAPTHEIDSDFHEYQRIIVLSPGEDVALSIPLGGATIAFYPLRATMAVFSNRQEYLFYATTHGAQLFDFRTGESHTLHNDPIGNFPVIYGSFSSDDSFLVAVGSVGTIVYNIKQKEMINVIGIHAGWAVFDPHNYDIIILGRRFKNEVMWWTRQGQLLHRFHLLNDPRKVSLNKLPNTYQLLVTDSGEYAYMLTPRISQTPIKVGELVKHPFAYDTSVDLASLYNYLPMAHLDVSYYAAQDIFNKAGWKRSLSFPPFKSQWVRQYVVPECGSAQVEWSIYENKEIKLGHFLPYGGYEERKKKVDAIVQFLSEFQCAIIAYCDEHPEDAHCISTEFHQLVDGFFTKAREGNHFGCTLKQPKPLTHAKELEEQIRLRGIAEVLNVPARKYKKKHKPDPLHSGVHIPIDKSLSLSLFGTAPNLQWDCDTDCVSFSLPEVHISLKKDGSAEFCHANWSLNVALPEIVLGPDTSVYSGSNQLITFKTGNFTEGLRMVDGVFKQFFLLPPRDTFTLRLQYEGVGKARFNKPQSTLVFFDQPGYAAVVYHKPYIINSNKEVTNVTWAPNTNHFTVTLPNIESLLLVLVFEISFAETIPLSNELGYESESDSLADETKTLLSEVKKEERFTGWKCCFL